MTLGAFTCTSDGVGSFNLFVARLGASLCRLPENRVSVGSSAYLFIVVRKAADIQVAKSSSLLPSTQHQTHTNLVLR